jgi:hypothetical protein
MKRPPHPTDPRVNERAAEIVLLVQRIANDETVAPLPSTLALDRLMCGRVAKGSRSRCEKGSGDIVMQNQASESARTVRDGSRSRRSDTTRR